MADYELRTFTLPADLEELFTAELWSRGTLGLEVHEAETGTLRLDAYFPVPLPPAFAAFDVAPWEERGVRMLAMEALAERDWLADYRAAAEPFDVGRRVPGRIPRIDAEPPAGERITLRIPARTAFGTGSHESTRLVLEWLEDLDLAQRSVLDVGTGSGILAFAAEHLGASRVVGCDVDAGAVCVARGNARSNGLSPRLFAGGAGALGAAARFDFVLVNILPESFAGEMPYLVRLLALGGRLVSSGNLADRRDELLAGWARHGLILEAERYDSEWVAFLLRADHAVDGADLTRGQTEL